MTRNLSRATARLLLLLFASSLLSGCVIDGCGRVYSPFVVVPTHYHHHHCR
jgi:hypothetical protein